MRLVSTEKAPKALGPYSQGYVHGGILYSAGQIAINPATDTVEAVLLLRHFRRTFFAKLK